MPPIRTATESEEPLLSVRDLRVSFALDEGTVRAVDGVSFEIFPGQVLGIVGESGCGKSITTKAILQLVEHPGRIEGGHVLFRPDAGAKAIDLAKLAPRGAEIRAIRGAEIALIPQEPMPEQRVDAYSWQLSGGLRQRAMIAMALSCKPRLLIADEPTTAIDVTTQAQVLALLRELQKKYGTAIIFITHDLGVIAQMANHVVVMYLGRVMEEGPVDDIFHAPKHPYTKALLRSIPSLHGQTRVALPVISGTLPHSFNRPSGCPFHPRCDDLLPGRCAHAVPSLQRVGARQQVSCFLYHDAADPA